MTIDIKKDLIRQTSDLSALVSAVLERSIYGSYSERTPHLGRMRTCPHCRIRRREFSIEKCCNPSHAKTVRRYMTEYDVKGTRERPFTGERGFGPTTRHEKGFYQATCEPRVTDLSTKRMVKKFQSRMRPGYDKRWGKEIYDLSLELTDENFRNTVQLLLEGLVGFHAPLRQVDIAGLGSFAEKTVDAIHKYRANKKRKSSKRSRRRNRQG